MAQAEQVERMVAQAQVVPMEQVGLQERVERMALAERMEAQGLVELQVAQEQVELQAQVVLMV